MEADDEMKQLINPFVSVHFWIGVTVSDPSIH